MNDDAEVIIMPEANRPFLLSHKDKPTFEFQLSRMVPKGQIREYDSGRIGHKLWEIERPWLPYVIYLVKECFGEYRYSVSRGGEQPVNSKAADVQLNLFRL